MMWIVKVALRAPYTFTVTGLLILIGGILSGLQMAKDIFPAINIPVVGVIWMYNGLPAQEMERRITTVSERALTTIKSEIVSGLNPGDVVVQNPTDDLQEGMMVSTQGQSLYRTHRSSWVSRADNETVLSKVPIDEID